MLWLMVSIVLWGLLHSFFAADWTKKLARRLFGPTADRTYRLAYNLFACISFIPLLIISAVTPDTQLYLVALPWLVLMIAGQLLAVAALVYGLYQTDLFEFLGLRQVAGSHPTAGQLNMSLEIRDKKLVTKGLYNYVRHPLYTAGLLFIWLMPLMTINLLIINATLTIYLIVGIWFEEQKLRRVFGQAYSDYAAITPMLLPFTRRNKSRRGSSM
jgi:protein-S-isoprenylcysteine O-methyltransferase Ste14